MNKIKIKILILGLITILIVGFGFYNSVEAAAPSVFVSPATLSKNADETFNLSIGVNPAGEKVCVVEGKLNLNKLSCQLVTMGDGITAQSSPTCNNLYFLLGIPGCTTNNKTLFTVTVKAISVGTATVNFTGIDIIGEGISISSASSGGSYTIASPCNCSAWSSWQNSVCGGEGCSSTQRLQTRTRACAPAGCDIESESRCMDNSNCLPLSEVEKPTTEEKMPQKSLLAILAMVWGGTSQLAILIMIATLCLVVLVFIGVKEWKIFQKKRRK